MSYPNDPPQGGRRGDPTVSFVHDASLMSEKTHLPDLDYKALAIASLTRLKTRTAAKPPTGRYDALVAYLQGRGASVDAAAVDKKTRTFFEDVINKIIANPSEWDADRVLDGKALMDYLAGVNPQQQAPLEAPPQDFQEKHR